MIWLKFYFSVEVVRRLRDIVEKSKTHLMRRNEGFVYIYVYIHIAVRIRNNVFCRENRTMGWWVALEMQVESFLLQMGLWLLCFEYVGYFLLYSETLVVVLDRK